MVTISRLNKVSEDRVISASQEPTQVMLDGQTVRSGTADDATPEKDINLRYRMQGLTTARQFIRRLILQLRRNLIANASVNTAPSSDPNDEIERLVAYRLGHGFCV